MAIMTEYGRIIAEIERKATPKPRLPAIERAAWMWRRKPVEPADHYQWLDPFQAAPEITETEEAIR